MDTQKFDKICAQYGNPYNETSFAKAAPIKEILATFAEEKEISAAGRIISLRGHGKSCFSHISDISGKIQIYARADIMAEGRKLAAEKTSAEKSSPLPPQQTNRK